MNLHLAQAAEGWFPGFAYGFPDFIGFYGVLMGFYWLRTLGFANFW